MFDPDLPDDPNSKVNMLVDKVYSIYEQNSANGATQLIFCDTATPKGEVNMDSYVLYRKGSDGYRAIYNHTMTENGDRAKKIADKLNSDNPPSDFECGGVFDGDILVLKKVDKEQGISYNEAFIMKDGKMVDEIGILDKTNTASIEQVEVEKNFSVYDDIKDKLISKGIPEEEIAFIHDAGNDTKKRQLMFDKLNNGEIRVMIGSTGKCGAGMNAQKKMIALHHLDAPYRPSDMQQRNGRIVRRGNENPEVQIYKYVTKGTFDAFVYQTLENKQKTFGMVMSEKSPLRAMEDIDEIQLSYAETVACCSGNPLIGEKLKLEGELADLRHAEKSYKNRLFALQNKLEKTLPREIEYNQKRLERCNKDTALIRSIEPLYIEKEYIVKSSVLDDNGNLKEVEKKEKGKLAYYDNNIMGKQYDDMKELGEKIKQVALSCTDNEVCNIGTYRGFYLTVQKNQLRFDDRLYLTIKGADSYVMHNSLEYKNMSTLIKRIDEFIDRIPEDAEDYSQRILEAQREMVDIRKEMNIPFSHADELKEKSARYDEICKSLEESGSYIEAKGLAGNAYDMLSEHFSEIFDNACPEGQYCYRDSSGIYEPIVIEKYKAADIDNPDAECQYVAIMQYAERVGYVIPDPLIVAKLDNETFEPIEFHSNFNSSDDLKYMNGNERSKAASDILTFVNDNFSEMLNSSMFVQTGSVRLADIPADSRLNAKNFSSPNEAQGTINNPQITDSAVNKAIGKER